MNPRRTLCTQNMTEGMPTKAARDADIFLSQERPSALKMRLGLPGKKHWFPAREKHMGISWNPAAFKVTDKGYEQYHGSGKAESWPIPTPSRGIAWVIGHYTDEPGTDYVYWTTWLLNSWQPNRPDKYTVQRRHLVETYELPVMRKRLAWFLTQGLSAGGGDLNTDKGIFAFPNYHDVIGHGLDRILLDTRLAMIGHPMIGPQTGVGPDLEHHSYTIATRKVS